MRFSPLDLRHKVGFSSKRGIQMATNPQRMLSSMKRWTVKSDNYEKMIIMKNTDNYEKTIIMKKMSYEKLIIMKNTDNDEKCR